jgi:hypothetical protein
MGHVRMDILYEILACHEAFGASLQLMRCGNVGLFGNAYTVVAPLLGLVPPSSRKSEERCIARIANF